MPVTIFCCYAHEDEPLLKKLKTHLFPLQRAGLVDVCWYDRDMSAGTDWEQKIKERLNTAQIILLLVSPDFLASDYCFSNEMQRAIERHEQGEAQVIPIILRPVYWQDVLGKLQALPTDAIPVMSSGWHYQDEAFFNVTEGIRNVAVKVMSSLPPSSQTLSIESSKPEPTETPANVLKRPCTNVAVMKYRWVGYLLKHVREKAFLLFFQQLLVEIKGVYSSTSSAEIKRSFTPTLGKLASYGTW